ncbi:MAG: alpha/beta hydrolase [Verrucomicrobiota bacterium]|nr:alpha/beta hydrolase [Verrucomicrobiota bacterium]
MNAPGKYIDVGGFKRHVVCQGNGFPVVLEAGLTAMSSCWAWVQENLAKDHLVLSYDRPGLGFSEASRERRTAQQIAVELHDLLEALNFPRPFLFVGHSMGGIISRAFHKLYPKELAGAVLIDPAHPDQLHRDHDIKRTLFQFFLFLVSMHCLSAARLVHWTGDFGLSEQAAGLPEENCRHAEYFFRNKGHLRETVREAREWMESRRFVGDHRFGTLPLTVITAAEKTTGCWGELQREIAALSSRGKQFVLEGSTHVSLLTDRRYAERIAEEARRMAGFLGRPAV